MDVASSPTAGVCLSPPVLRVSSRERSEISDATDTENFSCSFCSSFHFAFYNDKQEFILSFENPYRTATVQIS